ncbi:hypothetical protein [Sphingomonas sp. PP-CE-3A-406]|uniref:hypothetical protein n=1 Tax=Sphingomonas sp. PP-CE-3A-406 TaxID=2135659 RepID=UPI000EF9FFCB|nr:hypothetical protein [Sphingomonas sp. PP-CE-3A-406]
MNETSATSASGLSLLPDGIATLTAIHFTIIAVVAILVVIGLIWGIRAKRSRTKAAHDVIANAEEAGVPPEPVSANPAVEARDAEPSQTQTQKQAQPVEPVRVAAPPEPASPARRAPEPTPVARADDLPKTPDRPAADPTPASPPLDASPAVEPLPAAVPPVEDAPVETRAPDPAHSYGGDPVTQLKGLGPKVAARLGELGVSTIDQMAALTESEAQSIDAQLGNFTGRMHRDRWIEQARLLAAGDKAGFEAKFGKL